MWCDQCRVATILADYHLDDGVDGIELLHRLCLSRTPAVTAALISADHDADLILAARSAGFPLLHKPLRPAALRALLRTQAALLAGRLARDSEIKPLPEGVE